MQGLVGYCAVQPVSSARGGREQWGIYSTLTDKVPPPPPDMYPAPMHVLNIYDMTCNSSRGDNMYGLCCQATLQDMGVGKLRRCDR